MLGPGNVWAFGDSGTVADDIFHWNGSKWQHYLSSDINFIPQHISASAPNNVWVSGFAYSRLEGGGGRLSLEWHCLAPR